MTDLRAPGVLLREGSERLARAGVASPRVDAEVLLAHATGRSRGSLPFSADVSEAEAAVFDDLLRRRTTQPLQHVTGEVHFRHVTLAVGPGVFVPRPETEVLAGAAIAEVHRLQDAGVAHPLVVDLCAGSGAVAIAVATEASGARVLAVELSAQACAYARTNVASLAPQVEVLEADVADLPDLRPELAGQVHVVTANPPYIPLEEYETVPAEVRDHDPAQALWSGVDGLDATRVVEQVAAGLLVDDGLCLSEHADSQGDSAPGVFVAAGRWASVRDQVDLSGRPRHVVARRYRRAEDYLGQ